MQGYAAKTSKQDAAATLFGRFPGHVSPYNVRVGCAGSHEISGSLGNLVCFEGLLDLVVLALATGIVKCRAAHVVARVQL